ARRPGHEESRSDGRRSPCPVECAPHGGRSTSTRGYDNQVQPHDQHSDQIVAPLRGADQTPGAPPAPPAPLAPTPAPAAPNRPRRPASSAAAGSGAQQPPRTRSCGEPTGRVEPPGLTRAPRGTARCPTQSPPTRARPTPPVALPQLVGRRSGPTKERPHPAAATPSRSRRRD